MKETLGFRVKRERVFAKLTQDELAANLNSLDESESKINRGMVSKWENDRETPSLENLRKLCKLFNRPMDYFAISDDVCIEGLGAAFKDSREEAGLSTAELADLINVYETDLLRYEEDDPLSLCVAEDLCENIAGIGFYEFLDAYSLYDEYVPDIFDGDIEQYEKFKKALEEDWKAEYEKPPILEPKAESATMIPLLGAIAAGAPILAEEHIEEYIALSVDVKADFALKVRGDSMIGANIYDGDIVFIRQQPDVENGEIAAAMIIDPDTSDARATLKRVYKTPDGMMLVSENKNYPPIIVNSDNCDGAKILGKATYYITQAR